MVSWHTPSSQLKSQQQQLILWEYGGECEKKHEQLHFISSCRHWTVVTQNSLSAFIVSLYIHEFNLTVWEICLVKTELRLHCWIPIGFNKSLPYLPVLLKAFVVISGLALTQLNVIVHIPTFFWQDCFTFRGSPSQLSSLKMTHPFDQ